MVEVVSNLPDGNILRTHTLEEYLQQFANAKTEDLKHMVAQAGIDEIQIKEANLMCSSCLTIPYVPVKCNG